MKPNNYQHQSPYLNNYNEHLSYDKNGNILSLYRTGDLDSNVDTIEIDNLVYDYDSGNKLLKVTDNSGHPEGFKDGLNTGNDYVYDDFGNMTQDLNKEIFVRYNHLNLPLHINFEDRKYISYIYNALGQKVSKVVFDGISNVSVNTDYLGVFHYEDEVLSFFATAEGYVNVLTKGNKTSYNYVYNYTDHLGNIRVNYTTDLNGAPTILEENHYYPFGLMHKKYGSTLKELVEVEDGEDYYVGIDIVPPGGRKSYQYKYQGKEWQDELNLNVTAMDFRQYDNALGRFFSIDAVASSMPSVTPYHFGFNNPVYWADPTGLMPQWLQGMWNATPNGTNSHWINDGYGNFDNADGSGYVNRSGEYFANNHTHSETLPTFYIKGSWNGNNPHLRLNYDTEIQNHLYVNSSFHQYVRDERRAARWNSIQNDLDWFGAIPVIGEPIDLINAGISAVRGDYVGAGLPWGNDTYRGLCS